MLAEDKAIGAQANGLLARYTDAKHYPTVGCETTGNLLMLTSPKHTITM
jgi:hypothetical protein